MDFTGFRKSLEEAFGKEKAGVILAALENPASTSIRLNPLKKTSGTVPDATTALYGEAGKGCNAVPWCREGRILGGRPSFTLDPEFHAGAYYVQDSSSMFVGWMFRRILEQSDCGSGVLKVLDLCAAPGGKTTDIAAALREVCGDRFLLVSNEVMTGRSRILADNTARWGEPNVMVSSSDPSSFANLKDCFDIIITDVPCSGEGMFRKDDEAVRQWSEENVELCCARQKRILADVWPALKPSGYLLYSTCTFNRKENDGNVEWAAQELGADVLTVEADFSEILRTAYGYSLAPGYAPGEGQYCAALRKKSGAETARLQRENGSSGMPASDGNQRKNRIECRDTGNKRKNPRQLENSKGSQVSCLAILKNAFTFDASVREKNGSLIAVPSILVPELQTLSSAIRLICSGVTCGSLKRDKLVPDEDLVLCAMLRSDALPTVETDRQTALSYLHRDSIVLQKEAERGYVSLSYNGLRFGVVNNLGNRCNNLHPLSRRILMDIDSGTKQNQVPE